MFPLLLCLASADPTADDLAPRAAGVALVEVVSVTERDARPADGPLYEEVKLRLVRGSGDFTETVAAIKARGGLAPPGAPKPPPPKFSLKPGALEKGKRYWVAFSSPPEGAQFPGDVMGVWPEGDPKAAKILDEAVKADRWKWHPHYDQKTGLTNGRLVEPDKKQWRVRVEKGDKVLWETAIPGTPAKRSGSWGFWDSGSNWAKTASPESSRLLIAETALTLDAGNEFDLPAGPYYLSTAFDANTGKRLSARVNQGEGSPAVEVLRDYDPGTGRPQREERSDWPRTGGKAVGAKAEDWYRKVARTFDPKTGKVTAEEVFRWDDTKSGDERWVKVSPK